MNFDTEVKQHIYETIAETTRPPTSAEVAAALGRPVDKVETAFESLAKKRLLVLEPGDRSRIRMAPPFSGVETAFRVIVDDKSYFANCVWDALGVLAALGRDGEVEASDGFTEEWMSLRIIDGEPEPQTCAIHYAVPAAKWWDDIIFT